MPFLHGSPATNNDANTDNHNCIPLPPHLLPLSHTLPFVRPVALAPHMHLSV